MADLKSSLLARAERVLESPLAKRLLEDDRVMKVLIGLVGAPRTIRRVVRTIENRITRGRGKKDGGGA